MSHQRRRSISTPGHLYERLRAQCERDGQPVAAVVQGLIEQHLHRTEPRERIAYTTPDLVRALGKLTDGQDWHDLRDQTGLSEDECRQIIALGRACTRSPHYLRGGGR